MRILLVEDDPLLSEQIAEALRAEHFAVDAVADGGEALQMGQEEGFDAVILDPGVPTMDGFTVLKRWREGGLTLPVIVLTGSRKDVQDMRDAVRAGATNYLTKPVDLELLVDWVRGVVNSAGPNVRPPVLQLNRIKMDTAALRVWFDTKPVKITPTEYRLLHFLMTHNERPVTAEELARQSFDGDSLRTAQEIPVYVSRLRDKLDKQAIATVYGYGYQLKG